MKKITFLDADSFPAWIDTKPSVDLASHQWEFYPHTTSEQVMERIADSHIVLTNKVPLDAKTLSQAKNLEMISVTATGYNIIDIEAATKAGVSVHNAQNYATDAVAEHALSLILGLSKNLKAHNQRVAKGLWEQASNFALYYQPIQNLKGQTLGIIGAGTLGRALAQLAQGLGLNVLFAQRLSGAPAQAQQDIAEGVYRVPLDTLYAEANIISLHCPLTAQTDRLLDQAAFRKMAKNPLIINTARGGLIDEWAACEALKTEQIRGLATDVLSSEPPEPNNPLLAMADEPNVIITPHVAWTTDEAMTLIWNQTLENVRYHLNGSKIRNINNL